MSESDRVIPGKFKMTGSTQENIHPSTTASVPVKAMPKPETFQYQNTSEPLESSAYDILMTVNPFELDSASPLEHRNKLVNDEQCNTEDVDSTAIVDNLIPQAAASLSHEPVEEELQSAVIYEHNVNYSVDKIDSSENDAIYGNSNPTALDGDADTLQTYETETLGQLVVESSPKMPENRDTIQFIDPDTNELFSGSQHFHDKVIGDLRNQFSFSSESDSSMIYTGIEMSQSDREIIMH